MKSRFVALIVLSFSSTLSGCTLFHDDFDSTHEIVGMPPDSSPDGNPIGDMVQIWDADPGNLVITANGISHNGMIHSYQRSVSQADFIGKETGYVVQKYWAYRDGRAEGFSRATPRFFFTIGNHASGTANLEIVNGEWRCSGERLIDAVFAEDHAVIVSVDNNTGKYTATVNQIASTTSRAACPDGARFEAGECRWGPDLLGHRAHCSLELTPNCATCRDGEILDVAHGTCLTRHWVSASCSDVPLSAIGIIPEEKRLSMKNVI